MSAPFVHPTAIVEDGVRIGADSAIWDHVHLRRNATIGRGCIVGEKTYVAYDVVIGDLVKINACVYVCAGVTIEDGCMIAAHVVFTNDRTPRATDAEVTRLLPSEPGADLPRTVVRRGATLGANATVGPGVEIGTFAIVGMGAVVTRDVPPHALVVGNPARLRGLVDREGRRVWTAAPDGRLPPDGTVCECPDGGRIVMRAGAARFER